MPSPLDSLSRNDQQELLIKGWMGHDARWFMAVCQQYGIKVANKMNQNVARSVGVVETQRLMKALGISQARNPQEYLAFQETGISLYGPELLDYEIKVINENSFRFIVGRCFAHESVTKAGIADDYECGIFARIQGWVDAHGFQRELEPPLGKCLKVLGAECVYTFTLNKSKS